MKKLNSWMLTAMLICGGMAMTSCQGFVDALLGSEDTPAAPTKPQTDAGDEESSDKNVVVTKDVATISISSLADYANSISGEANQELVEAIKAKADVGDEYVIHIGSEKPLTTEDVGEISLPKVVNADIKLIFDNAVATTADKPLAISASETASDTSTDAVNSLTVVMKDAQDVNLVIDMPETSVTLANEDAKTMYNSVSSTTALNTLYVESGVVIDELEVKGGRVVVKEGGAIETYVYAPNDEHYLLITNEGLELGKRYSEEIEREVSDEKGNPYFVQNVKVVKGEKEYATIGFLNDSEHPLKKLIIADGAAVYSYNIHIPCEIIEGYGHGNSRFLYGNVGDDSQHYAYLHEVSSASGVVFSPIAEGTDTNPYNLIGTPLLAKDCVFEADEMYFPNNYCKDCTFKSNYVLFNRYGDENLYIDNCKFESDSEEACTIEILSDAPFNGEKSFQANFHGCDFGGKVRFVLDQTLDEQVGEFATDKFEFLLGLYGGAPTVVDFSIKRLNSGVSYLLATEQSLHEILYGEDGTYILVKK